ncbi:uncharacterized protein LOC117640078 [Thrips palmi]|uniref:Uncharacterized protein LOC117640078 n=1 Tax=Thrips palmi TaxID=161013 RepID=A0A6P8Y6L4_THRPL|nr:uncharacterized protein LOC117640078 [Thrips palmi]
MAPNQNKPKPGSLWCGCTYGDKEAENLEILDTLASGAVPLIPVQVSHYRCKDLHGWAMTAYIKQGFPCATDEQAVRPYVACKDDNRVYQWAAFMTPASAELQGVGTRKAIPSIKMDGLKLINSRAEKAQLQAEGYTEFKRIGRYLFLKLDEPRHYPFIVYWTKCSKCVRKKKRVHLAFSVTARAS